MTRSSCNLGDLAPLARLVHHVDPSGTGEGNVTKVAGQVAPLSGASFPERCNLGHFQVGSYRYRSLIEGLYTL